MNDDAEKNTSETLVPKKKSGPQLKPALSTEGDNIEIATRIKNSAMAGCTTHAVTGKDIVFDAEGVATCDEADAASLLSIPGFDIVED